MKENKSKLHWIWIAGLAIMGILLMLLRGCWPEATQPEFNQVEIDLNAERIQSDSEAGTYMELTAKQDVTVDLTSGTASLYFVNPASSSQDVVLSLQVEDAVIGQSGRVSPGYSLETITDLDTQELEPGIYDGALIVDSYDAATGEKSMVNAEIKVSVNIIA